MPTKYLGGEKKDAGWYDELVDWQFERYRLDVLVGPEDFLEGAEFSSFGPQVKLEDYLANGRNKFTSKKKWYAGFWDADDKCPTFIPIESAKKWLVDN